MANTLTLKKKKQENVINLHDIATLRKLELVVVKDILQSSFEHILNEIDRDAELEFIWEDDYTSFSVSTEKIVIDDADFSERLSESKTNDEKDLLLVTYISLSEAKKLKKDVEIDDLVRDDINYADLSAPRTKKINNLFSQNLSKATKSRIYETYKEKIGDQVKVKVTNTNRGYFTLSFIDDPETITSIFETDVRGHYKNRKININSIFDVYITEVLEEPKKNGSMIVVSVTSPYEIIALLKTTFKEIESKKILVKRIARRAGVRAKIAIERNFDLTDSDFDALGILIGQAGQRNQILSEALGDEKIDFIKWNEDHAAFMLEAIKPARVISIKSTEIREGVYVYDLVVPDSMVSVAIGKGGVNANLASDITRSRINIKSLADATTEGDEVLWNANVSKEEVASLDNYSFTNKRVARNAPRGEAGQNLRRRNNAGFNSFNMDEFEKDFAAFDSYFENIKNTPGEMLEQSKKIEVVVDGKKVEKQPTTPKHEEFDYGLLDASFDEINADIESFRGEQKVVSSESNVAQRKAGKNQKVRSKLNYTIADDDFADFAMDGINFDELEDDEWE